MAVQQGIKPLVTPKLLEQLKLLGSDQKYIEFVEAKEPHIAKHLAEASRIVADDFLSKQLDKDAEEYIEALNALILEYYHFALWGYYLCDAARDIDFKQNWDLMWGTNATPYSEGK